MTNENFHVPFFSWRAHLVHYFVDSIFYCSKSQWFFFTETDSKQAQFNDCMQVNDVPMGPKILVNSQPHSFTKHYVIHVQNKMRLAKNFWARVG